MPRDIAPRRTRAGRGIRSLRRPAEPRSRTRPPADRRRAAARAGGAASPTSVVPPGALRRLPARGVAAVRRGSPQPRPDIVPGPARRARPRSATRGRAGACRRPSTTSLERGVIGFLIAIVVGTPIGLLLAEVRPLRRAVGPIISGLQVLPSVAWVPAAIIWFGLSDATVYFVILMGAIPSIVNGLIAGVDQVPPQLRRVGTVLGASRWQLATAVILPAALPGYFAGLKQGWAFSWRSLMAAEIIAIGGTIGFGLGLDARSSRASSPTSPGVLGTIIVILAIGILIELVFFGPDRAPDAAAPGTSRDRRCPMTDDRTAGKVWLVGAGPGDPGPAHGQGTARPRGGRRHRRRPARRPRGARRPRRRRRRAARRGRRRRQAPRPPRRAAGCDQRPARAARPRRQDRRPAQGRRPVRLRPRRRGARARARTRASTSRSCRGSPAPSRCPRSPASRSPTAASPPPSPSPPATTRSASSAAAATTPSCCSWASAPSRTPRSSSPAASAAPTAPSRSSRTASARASASRSARSPPSPRRRRCAASAPPPSSSSATSSRLSPYAPDAIASLDLVLASIRSRPPARALSTAKGLLCDLFDLDNLRVAIVGAGPAGIYAGNILANSVHGGRRLASRSTCSSRSPPRTASSATASRPTTRASRASSPRCTRCSTPGDRDPLHRQRRGRPRHLARRAARALRRRDPRDRRDPRRRARHPRHRPARLVRRRRLRRLVRRPPRRADASGRSTPREVAVIGNGNVALDVARVLAKHAVDLRPTEIADNVLAGLEASAVTDVHVFGRRGPADIKFTPDRAARARRGAGRRHRRARRGLRRRRPRRPRPNNQLKVMLRILNSWRDARVDRREPPPAPALLPRARRGARRRTASRACASSAPSPSATARCAAPASSARSRCSRSTAPSATTARPSSAHRSTSSAA